MRKLFLLILAIYILFQPASEAAAQASVRVYYAGPQGSVYTALELAGNIEIVSDPQQAQVIVLNDSIPDPQLFANLKSAGSGLIVFLGPHIKSQDLETVLGIQTSLEYVHSPLSLTPVKGGQDPLVEDIVWNSAPQVRERSQLLSPNSNLIPLVLGFEDNSLVLGELQNGGGQVFIFTPTLNNNNPQFQEWAYFNYLVYHLTMRASGNTPLSYADYPASPVPHTQDREYLFGLLAGMLALAVTIFIFVRRLILQFIL